MNERPLIPTSEPSGERNWLDAYIDENELALSEQKPKLFDLNTVRGILFRQRWLIAGVMVAAIVAGLIATLLATPMYEARSSVLVEPYGTVIVEGQDLDPTLPSNQIRDMMATHIGVINSRSLALTVAEDLDLANRTDFLDEDIAQARPAGLSDEQWAEAKQGIAADRLHNSVSADIPANNWIIEIAYRSRDPEIAAEIANAYAAAFASAETRDTVENNEYAQNYLREQIESVSARLEVAEQAANAYARNSGIILQPSAAEDEGSGYATLRGTNLANINERVSAARAARIESEQRWRAIQNLPPSQLSQVQNNSLLQGLIGQRASKQAELTSLRQRFGEAHPQIVGAERQVEELNAEIAQRSSDIKSTARTEYEVARNQELALQSELDSATGAKLQEQDSQVEYGVLEREAQALREQLEVLLARFNEVSSASNVQTGTINLLDRAVVPSGPYSPSLMLNFAIALVFGMALAGGLAVLRETFDDRIRSLEDVEERSGIPLLGHTPYLPEREMEDEGTNRFGALMEAYASIRSTLDFSIPRNGCVIQLTSSQASEGKSTTAVILAELFAGMGRKTLLIDGDLRRPSISSLLGISRTKVGIAEVLLGQAELRSAIMKGSHENLDILPVGERPSNPSELLASSQLKEFLEGARGEYSLIVIDSSPVLGLADAPVLSRLVDGTVFVMEANNVSYRQVRASIRRLRANGGKIFGGILTKYRALEAGESYNYQYAYYEYRTDTKR